MEKDYANKKPKDKLVPPVAQFRDEPTITEINKDAILQHLDEMLEFYTEELTKVSNFKEDDKETERIYHEITGVLRGLYLTRDNLDFIQRGYKKIKVDKKPQEQLSF